MNKTMNEWPSLRFTEESLMFRLLFNVSDSAHNSNMFSARKKKQHPEGFGRLRGQRSDAAMGKDRPEVGLGQHAGERQSKGKHVWKSNKLFMQTDSVMCEAFS